MGCDIHMCLEVMDRDGVWKSKELYEKNWYYNNGEDDELEYEQVDVYNERDYSLFAALAGVRDYSPGTPKIDEPRGIPYDASKETKARCKWYEGDAHSSSVTTLKELYEFQENNKKIPHSGLITQDAADNLDNNGVTPSSWCQGSTDTSRVHREWESDGDVMGELIESIESQASKIAMIWSPKEESARVRIIFWFDN